MSANEVSYYCADCKCGIPESETESVLRGPDERMVAHKGCGGQVLYYAADVPGFFIALAQWVDPVPLRDQGYVMHDDQQAWELNERLLARNAALYLQVIRMRDALLRWRKRFDGPGPIHVAYRAEIDAALAPPDADGPA